ncbi:MAG: nuclear transport factor 2 family protein [Actinomycetota bacterium]
MTPEDLVEIEEIKRLKHRYARLLDTKDWDGLRDCFVEEATASYSGGQLSFEGRDAIIGFLKKALGPENMVTSHAMGQPEIDLTGPDSASGTWALQDLVIVTDGALEIRGAAFYDDRYVRTRDGWRFLHTGYRRVYEEMGPRRPEIGLTATWGEGCRSAIVSGETPEA